METKEITMLRQEIDELRARIDDLAKAQTNDRQEAIKAIKDVYTTAYGSIGTLYEYLWPVIHKVFPKYAESQAQIDAFMKGRPPIEDEEKRP